MPIYGKGKNSREWIYVSDHCEALYKVYLKGKIGQFYNIGSNKNLNNLEVSKSLLNVSKKLIKLGKKVKILSKVILLVFIIYLKPLKNIQKNLKVN